MGQDSNDVLVVDDDRYLCDLVVDVLEASGHAARKAANGVEALKQVRERKPKLILLDLMMPVMNGWEVAAALRANPEWADIPVVIITADYDVERGRQQTGARAVITKPFDIDHLTQVVSSYTS
jgi:two-component system chemotaxis response regulator CheY